MLTWWPLPSATRAPMPAERPCLVCSSDPVEVLLGTRSTQGPAERLDIAGARVEFLGAEQGDQIVISPSEDERQSCTHGQDVLGSVISVIGLEFDVELIATTPPVFPLREQSMGDIAQRAVRPAESGPDPVTRFAEQGAVGVIDTDEFPHGIWHRPRVPGG